MIENLEISLLADHPEAIHLLKRWFEKEWVSYYGPTGQANADDDLLAYRNRSKLPIGVVAYFDGKLCGFAALKSRSITTHSHLRPWAAAGLVAPPYRRRGIGAHLLVALEELASALGYSRIYCGTSKAISILCRSGWKFVERLNYNGEEITIYEKFL